MCLKKILCKETFAKLHIEWKRRTIQESCSLLKEFCTNCNLVVNRSFDQVLATQNYQQIKIIQILDIRIKKLYKNNIMSTETVIMWQRNGQITINLIAI